MDKYGDCMSGGMGRGFTPHFWQSRSVAQERREQL